MLPEEIIDYEFSRSFKGYNITEVEKYIDNLISMYEQLANENKELNARLEQSRQTVLDAQKINDDKESIIKRADAEAENIISRANDTSSSIIAESEKIKAEAQKEAKSTLDAAMLDSKKLMRATKQSCQKRLEEADAEIAKIKAEHDRIMSLTALFKKTLFEAYSDQLNKIENIDVPQCFLEEPSAENQIKADTAQEPKPEAKAAAEQKIQDEPKAAQEIKEKDVPRAEQEQIYDFAGGVLVKKQSTPQKTNPSDKETKYKPSLYAGIEVKKEHSGRLRYDSKDIESVNKTLDTIIEKKGKDPSASERNGKSKLGFLK